MPRNVTVQSREADHHQTRTLLKTNLNSYFTRVKQTGYFARNGDSAELLRLYHDKALELLGQAKRSHFMG